jgi:hypothetical protein
MSNAELLADLWQKLHPDTVVRWVKKDDAHVAEKLNEIIEAAEAWLQEYKRGKNA